MKFGPGKNMLRKSTSGVSALAIMLYTLVPALAQQSVGQPAASKPSAAKLTGVPTPRLIKTRTGAHVSKPFKPLLKLGEEPSDVELTAARVFLQPLIPMLSKPVAGENRALATALKAYQSQPNRSDVATLEKFISQYPDSRWRAALEFNIAMRRFEAGYLSDALHYLNLAWKDSDRTLSLPQKDIADSAVAELVMLEARLGLTDELKTHFAQIENRALSGSNQLKVSDARLGLRCMQTDPGHSYRCGPLAVNSLLFIGQPAMGQNPVLKKALSTDHGTNLAQVNEWARQVGLNYQMARRTSAEAQLMVPSIMHWKVQHFCAVTQASHGKYHVQDPTFGSNGSMWITSDAINKESDGYFLVPAGQLPAGWVSVDENEGARVWGKGDAQARNNGKGPGTPKTDPAGDPGCGGMARMSIFTMQATENISDAPVSYNCPIGAPMQFLFNYNYQEANQPGTFSFPNVGPNWSFNWVSYITLDSSLNATVIVRGGGSQIYNFTLADNVTNPYPPDVLSQSLLTVPSAGTYNRLLPDGSVEIFNQTDGSGRIFLTQVLDPQGNATNITYDSNFRITAITDPLGQVTTVTYKSSTLGNAGFYKIAQISDPFGRTATFAYTDSNYTSLQSITDCVGMTSQFLYDANTSQIVAMTTPYGTTTFYQYTPSTVTPGLGLQVNLPDGTSAVLENYINETKTTYYWNRHAMSLYPNDPANQIYSHAYATNFQFDQSTNNESAVPQNEKPALESAIFYTYPGSANADLQGTSNRPATVQRVVGNTALSRPNQTYTRSYNNFGKTTQSIDPLGRTFSNFYAANNVDLLERRQTQSNSNDLLGKWQYNGQHRPLSYIDGSGQKTQYSYNSYGEISSLTDANGNVSTYSYVPSITETIGGTISGNTFSITVFNSALPGGQTTKSATGSDAATVAASLANALASDSALQAIGLTATSALNVVMIQCTSANVTTYSQSGGATGTVVPGVNTYATYLTKYDGPLAGNNDVTKFGYDNQGRLYTVTDSEGYTVIYNWDSMDRPTLVTYPDGTFEQTIYDKLDAVLMKDRIGRWTERQFDSIDQLLTQVDPLGRKTNYTWCDCGSMSTLTDPAGNVTTWQHDLEGRTTSKVYADQTHVDYVYELNDSRLYTKTNARGQVETFSYNLDNSTSQLAYSDTNTSTVSFAYDPYFMRQIGASNGWGSYVYGFNPYIQDPYRPGNIFISGTPTTGDSVNVKVTNSTLSGGQRTVQYVVQSTDTSLATLANSIASRLNADSGLSGAGIVSSVVRNRVQSMALGGSAQSGDSISITVNDAALSGGTETVSYSVVGTDGLPEIASGLASAINNDKRLSNIGVTASSTSTILAISSQSASPTTYSTAIGGTSPTETVTADPAPCVLTVNAPTTIGTVTVTANSNGTTVQTISGTMNNGHSVSTTVYDSGLVGGPITKSHTISGTETPGQVASALATLINGDTNLQALGITASAPTAALSISSTSPNLTTYSYGVSGGVGEIVTQTQGPGEACTTGGAGQLAAVSNTTISNSVVTYGYDALERTVSKQINGNANPSAWLYDPMSRVVSETNPLGMFKYAYVDDTSGSSKGTLRLASIAYPNGQATNYSWYGNTGDQRLQEIANVNPTGTTLSQFDYQYDSAAQITQWEQQQNGGNVYFNMAYDPAGQLITAQTGGATQPPYTTQHYYSYDQASNRLAQEIVTSSANTVTQGGYNNVNELTVVAPGGPSRFQGTTNKAVTTAAVQTSVVSINCTSPNPTTYSTNIVGTTTVSVDLGTNRNGNITASVGGTTTTLPTRIDIIVTNSALSGGSYTASYFPSGVTSLIDIATGIAGAINVPTLGAIGCTASNNTNAFLADAKHFSADVPLATESPSGNNSTNISAQDAQAPPVTANLSKHVAIVGTGTSSLSYDSDGNMTDDGTNTYTWDQENRLIKITYPGTNNYSQMVYDSFGRCTTISEYSAGSLTDTRQLIWCGSTRCELRDSSPNQKIQLFGLGENIAGSNNYFNIDHLHSVREMTDATGAIEAQYSYDSYGVQSAVGTPSLTPDFGYAGYYLHSRSGLNLTRTRAYSAGLGRFISRDPIGESGGTNLYDYVANNPVSSTDPSGLIIANFFRFGRFQWGNPPSPAPPPQKTCPSKNNPTPKGTNPGNNGPEHGTPPPGTGGTPIIVEPGFTSVPPTIVIPSIFRTPSKSSNKKSECEEEIEECNDARDARDKQCWQDFDDELERYGPTVALDNLNRCLANSTQKWENCIRDACKKK